MTFVKPSTTSKKLSKWPEATSEIRYIPYSEAYGEGFEDMQAARSFSWKAKRLFGYQPTRTLENIINDVAEQFREELKSETANA